MTQARLDVQANTGAAEQGLQGVANAAAAVGTNVQRTVLPMLAARFAGGLLVGTLGALALRGGILDNVLARLDDSFTGFQQDIFGPLLPSLEQGTNTLDRLLNTRFPDLGLSFNPPGQAPITLERQEGERRTVGERLGGLIDRGPTIGVRQPGTEPSESRNIQIPVGRIAAPIGTPGNFLRFFNEIGGSVANYLEGGPGRPAGAPVQIFNGPVYGVEDFERRAARGAVDTLRGPNGSSDLDGTLP